LGIRIELVTFGGLPAGKTGCSAPERIHVSTVRVASAKWHTSFRLRVGDSVTRVKRLYPNARASNGVPGWYRRGYWLVTRRTGCLGACGDKLFVTVPVLVAEIENNLVTSFVFVVGAQGE
jgi:hypothetical protein